MRWVDVLLVVLQAYFVLMNVTVERYYCHSEFEDGDSRFLVQETIDFCRLNNRLFLSRPRWMKVATCVSAYGFAPFYVLIAITAITGCWSKVRIPLLVFIGAKMNALFFYHLMEFTSDTPPQHLGPYFATEGPYLISMAIVLARIAASFDDSSSSTTAKKNSSSIKAA